MGCQIVKKLRKSVIMLLPRIIPCLLVKNKGLVKTIGFKDPKYIGDPINAVKIFNEKEVDEIIVIDIDATGQKREPDYTLIEHLASECRMPLCYGGGVKNSDQVQRIIQLGVEKVAISSAAINDPDLVSNAARRVGSQSIVVVLDVKKSAKGIYEIWTNNGQTYSGKQVQDLAMIMEERGAGELVLNSIDNDGLMKGYDFVLVDTIYNSIKIPVTVLGGAGCLNDIGELINRFGIIGASAGSLFVFKGKYRAVLINYPNHDEKSILLNVNNN